MSDRSTKQRRQARTARSLIFDVAGATLAMMAVAMIPMAAMAGSAIDVSRLYVAKVRLQQACDAGALAGRKFMTGTALDETARTQAQKFFASNFPAGWLSTTDVAFTPEDTADSQITATATATVPMAVMTMFGKDPVRLTVSCDAKLEIANADIMFVLDTTGSMSCAASDATSSCDLYVYNNTNLVGGRWKATEKSNARIKALRTAVLSFYDTIDAAVDSEAQLRFGFVPYSAAVNVGELLPADYLVNNWTYQSREANMFTPSESSPTSISMQTNGSSITQTQCTNYGNAGPTTSGSPPSTVTTTYYSYGDWGAVSDTSGTDRTCRRKRAQTTTTYTQDNANGTWFRDWTYKPVTRDVSQFKLGNSVTTRTGPSGTNLSSTWNGCIEERDTDAVSSPPSNISTMHDLDIDGVPTSQETRWRPAWPQIVFNRNSAGGDTTTDEDVVEDDKTVEDHERPTFLTTACPKQAQWVEPMTRAQVSAYVNAADFIAHGYTYHDIGLTWGARILSPTGIFAAHNTSAPNGREIARHIIFMTDGDMKPQMNVDGVYGMEYLDHRIIAGTPTDAELKNRHNARFNRLCVEARNKNITLWVIAYAQTMTNELRNCATPGKAFYASNDAELKSAFERIAAQIADLRLSK